MLTVNHTKLPALSRMHNELINTPNPIRGDLIKPPPYGHGGTFSSEYEFVRPYP